MDGLFYTTVNPQAKARRQPETFGPGIAPTGDVRWRLPSLQLSAPASFIINKYPPQRKRCLFEPHWRQRFRQPAATGCPSPPCLATSPASWKQSLPGLAARPAHLDPCLVGVPNRPPTVAHERSLVMIERQTILHASQAPARCVRPGSRPSEVTPRMLSVQGAITTTPPSPRTPRPMATEGLFYLPHAPFPRCSSKGCVFPAAAAGSGRCSMHELEAARTSSLSVLPADPPHAGPRQVRAARRGVR